MIRMSVLQQVSAARQRAYLRASSSLLLSEDCCVALGWLGAVGEALAASCLVPQCGLQRAEQKGHQTWIGLLLEDDGMTLTTGFTRSSDYTVFTHMKRRGIMLSSDWAEGVSAYHLPASMASELV